MSQTTAPTITRRQQHHGASTTMARNPTERAKAIGIWSGVIGLAIAIVTAAQDAFMSGFNQGSFVAAAVVATGAVFAVAVLPSKATS